MLKLAICEDNDIQCRQIHTLSCSSLEIPVEIDTFSSATDFLNQISNEQCPYHIILMDIELGSESVQYASSVYETNHIYFVYKQQMEKYLPKALSAACRKLSDLQQKYFCFNYQSRDYRLLRSDVLFMERKLRNTEIHTKSKIYYCREKISVLIEQLKPDFCICHKSFAVNINAIHTLSHAGSYATPCYILHHYIYILFPATFSQTDNFQCKKLLSCYSFLYSDMVFFYD